MSRRWMIHRARTNQPTPGSDYVPMRSIERRDYLEFLGSHDSVLIGDAQVKLCKNWVIRRDRTANFAPEQSTVWSFPYRGDWATHNGSYRGNWSPFIPRNLIHRFTLPGDLVCDPMVGSGTTLVECKLMGRRGVGVDINLSAVIVSMNRLDFELQDYESEVTEQEIKLFCGDVRNLNELDQESVDLVATHPPYGNIISYSKASGDLSRLSLDDFVSEMKMVASECFRILKPNKHCAILIGDTRKHQHYVPIHVGILNKFLESGFVLKEEIIKLQHNTLGGRELWSGKSHNFYKIAHEHLYVFRKPTADEDRSSLRYSMKWW